MEKKLLITERPIAFTDVETTGLDPDRHEIIEIGLVVAAQPSLRIIGELDIKVRALRVVDADPEALAVNGYRPEAWTDAADLADAMRKYAAMTKDAIFCAHNVTFDNAFIRNAFRSTGTPNPMDYHRIDIFTLAWAKLRGSGLSSYRLGSIAEAVGVPPEPLPHRAVNGARLAYDVYRKLMALP